MEPRIQYAKTKDEVSIAYWTLGEGTPLVLMPTLFSPMLAEWRGWHERLAKKRKLVLYDCRGSGLSERDVTDYSLEALVVDLEAVVDSLGIDTFAVLGWLHSGPAAIAYAARRLDRVSHLILWCTYASNADYQRSPQVQAFRALRETLVDQDWELFGRTWADLAVGGGSGGIADRLAAYYRGFATPEAVQAAMKATLEFDVGSLLPDVASPTLVLARREVRLIDVAVARNLSSRIPDASLVLLEGTSLVPFLDDTESVATAIDEFLGEGVETAAQAAPVQPGGLATILFTDIESSTALTQRLGDAKAQDLVRAHNTIVRDALEAQGGSEIKHTGDGIMASFPSASGALECAIAIQRAVAALRQAQGGDAEPTPDQAEPVEAPLRVRIGLNAGEPVAEEHPDGQADLFGTAVQLARRICDHGQPAQIVASDVVRQLAAGKGFLFSDIGETELRGFEDPVRLYEVRWREGAVMPTRTSPLPGGERNCYA